MDGLQAAYQGEIGRETTATDATWNPVRGAYQGEIGRETTAMNGAHIIYE